MNMSKKELQAKINELNIQRNAIFAEAGTDGHKKEPLSVPKFNSAKIAAVVLGILLGLWIICVFATYPTIMQEAEDGDKGLVLPTFITVTAIFTIIAVVIVTILFVKRSKLLRKNQEIKQYNDNIPKLLAPYLEDIHMMDKEIKPYRDELKSIIDTEYAVEKQKDAAKEQEDAAFRERLRHADLYELTTMSDDPSLSDNQRYLAYSEWCDILDDD